MSEIPPIRRPHRRQEALIPASPLAPNPTPRGPRFAIGTVVQSKSTKTSKVEDVVRQKLEDAGFAVHKGRSAIQCGWEPTRGNYPILTPDILISHTKICIEIDSDYTHGTDEARDMLRDALLAAVGWTVIRLRLGGMQALGEYDVVTDSSSPTVAVMEALVATLGDAIAGRAGTVRFVAKKPRAATPKEAPRLGAITPHKHYDNAFYVAWTATDGQVLRLVAMDSGRYLAGTSGWAAPRYIRALPLHETPRKEWRAALQAILDGMEGADFEPVSTFPWGESLFIGEQAEKTQIPEKFNIGGSALTVDAQIIGATSWKASGILGGDTLLAGLHPDAVTLGWRLSSVAVRSGRYGGFLEIQLRRDGGIADAE